MIQISMDIDDCYDVVWYFLACLDAGYVWYTIIIKKAILTLIKDICLVKVNLWA